MVHVDIKAVPPTAADTANWDAPSATAHNKKRRRGYTFLHHAVDDHSRLAYSEVLADEVKETAAAFRGRANRFFRTYGITVKSLLTDNESCYRS